MIWLIYILSLSTVVSCAQVSSTPPEPVRSVLTGNWGWNERECEEAPSKVTFSEDGALMFFSSDAGLVMNREGRVSSKLTYGIIAEHEKGLRAVIIGEERRTDRGDVVLWDLLLISDTRFCWHREDWPNNRCTKALIRCE